MNNPLYKQIQQQNQNPINGFMQKFNQFRQSFSGDPQEQIQKLMNSGRISQQDYNNAYQMAQQMMRMISGK